MGLARLVSPRQLGGPIGLRLVAGKTQRGAGFAQFVSRMHREFYILQSKILMGNLESSVAPEVIQRLVNEPPRPGEESIDGLKLRGSIDSGSSWVWIYDLESQPEHAIVVKLFSHPTEITATEPAAEREFRILSSLERELSHFPRLHVPHPIIYLEDANVIVTREVAGERADRVLMRDFRYRPPWSRFFGAPDAANLLCSTIGRWVDKVHDLDRLEVLPTGGETSLAELLSKRYREAELRMSAIGMQLDKELRLIRTYFVSRLPNYSRDRAVLYHPDFSPHNMIDAPDGLYVLDVSDIGYGHALEDVAFFWAYLEMLRSSPWASARRIAQCQATFLSEATDQPKLPIFWQRWGMFMRLSYLGRSREQLGKLKGIQALRRNMLRRYLKRWLAAQSWDEE